METNELSTIHGIIIPADWDDQGRVIRLAIVTYNEDTVMIAPTAGSADLIPCLRKKVTINGIVRHRGPGREIEVQACALDESTWK